MAESESHRDASPVEPEHLLRQERDIRDRLGGEPFDFEAAQAIQNIYRAAAAVRTRAERELLAERKITWGGFTMLWVLWVWGAMDASTLAAECGVAKGTMTGMVNTLEKRRLVVRSRDDADRRRVEVALTESGRELIAELYPLFNRFEVTLTDALSAEQRQELARLLRVIIERADE